MIETDVMIEYSVLLGLPRDYEAEGTELNAVWDVFVPDLLLSTLQCVFHSELSLK